MKQSNRTSIYILVIIGAMLLFVFYLQHTISENTQKLKALEVEKAREFAGKIERYMNEEVKGKALLDALQTDPEKRKELNRPCSSPTIPILMKFTVQENRELSKRKKVWKRYGFLCSIRYAVKAKHRC